MPLPRVSNKAVYLAVTEPVVGVATTTTAYVDMSTVMELYGLIQATVTGSADAKLVQATDNSGTGKKDITGKAITQLTADGSAGIELRQDEKGTTLLDVDNGFIFVAIEMVTTNAADVVSGQLMSVYERTQDNVPTGSVLDEIVRQVIS